MSFKISSDLYVKFSDIRRTDTNAPLTAGSTCTCQLLTTAGVAVNGGAVSMSQIGSTSAWEGTIPDTDTAQMTDGTQYKVRVIYTDGSGWVRTIEKRDAAGYD